MAKPPVRQRPSPEALGSPHDTILTLPASSHEPLESSSGIQRDLIDQALHAEFGIQNIGAPEHRGRLPRARIAATGLVGGTPNASYPYASAINRTAGTLVLAEGGSLASAETMARGFVWAAANLGLHRKHSASAAGRIDRMVAQTLPPVVERVNERLAMPPSETETSIDAVQIVDGSIVHTGRQLMYVYNPDAGTCVRLDRGLDGRSLRYPLNAGRNIVVISNGHEDTTTAPSEQRIAEEVDQSSQDDLPGMTDDISVPEHLELLATHTAKRLRALLTEDGSDGSVLVSVIDVEAWKDERYPLQRVTDYLRISSLILLVMSRKAAFHSRKRREIYEGATALSRRMAWAADVAVGVGLPALAYLAVKDSLNDHGLLASLPHLLDGANSSDGSGTPNSADTLPQSSVHIIEPTAPSVSHTAPPESTLPETALPDDSAPPPTSAPPLAESYTALSTDPQNNGEATSVTSITRTLIEERGRAAGLPESSVVALRSNEQLVAGANEAFMKDTANPHNGLVEADDNRWLNAGDEYSTAAQGKVVQAAVLEEAHRLGVAPPSPPMPPAQPANPTPTAGADDLSARIADALERVQGKPYTPKHSNDVYTIPIVAGMAVTATMLALHTFRRASRHHRQSPAAELPLGQTHPSDVSILHSPAPGRIPGPIPIEYAPSRRAHAKPTNRRIRTVPRPNGPYVHTATERSGLPPNTRNVTGPGRHRTVNEIFPDVKLQPRWKDTLDSVRLLFNNPTDPQRRKQE